MKTIQRILSYCTIIFLLGANSSCIKETNLEPSQMWTAWELYSSSFYDIEMCSNSFMTCYRASLVLKESDKVLQQQIIHNYFSGYTKIQVAEKSLTLTDMYGHETVIKSNGSDFTSSGACWSVAYENIIISFTHSQNADEMIWKSELLKNGSLASSADLNMELKISAEGGSHLFVSGSGNITVEEKPIPYVIDNPIGRDYGRNNEYGFNFCGEMTINGNSPFPVKVSISDHGTVTCTYRGQSESTRYYY